jgi:hypothetical protein
MSKAAGAMSAATTGATAGQELTTRDLQEALGAFAVSLHEATGAGRKLELDIFGAPGEHRYGSPAETLLEISADFVTPGDLLRSASLVTVGELRP